MISYTDGATSNNGYSNSQGGWAFIIIKDNEIIYKNNGSIKNSTNNICELTAVIKACEYLEKYYPLENNIIYTDSAYIANCYIQKWYKKWISNNWLTSKKTKVLNQSLWESLIPYFEKNNFNFEKVKGHADDKFNKIVDGLAVEAKKLC